MAKPIFVVKVPGSKISVDAMMDLKFELCRSIGKEYHTLVIPCDTEGFAFECFNADNVPPINEEQLKELCKTSTAND